MLQGKLRTALFLLFVLSFCITSGGILFYAYGFRFDTTRDMFIYGGSITLKSNPVEIHVTLDGVPIPEKDLARLNQSYHITGIAPGEHFLEVSTPGYQTWNKRIIVRSGISNEFWNITLPRQHYETTPYPNTDGLTRYFQSPEPTVFAGIDDRNQTVRISMYDTEQTLNDILYQETNTSLALEKNENLEWSTAADRIVFPILLEEKRHIITVDTETKAVRDLSTELNQFSMRRPRWNPSVRDSLLYQIDDRLYRLDLGIENDSVLEPLLLAEHVATYDISGSDIFIAKQDDNHIYRFSADQKEPVFRLIVADSLPAIDQAATLVVYDEYRIALISSQGLLTFFNDYLDEDKIRTLAEQDIVGVQFSDDGKKLLFFSQHSISVYFIRPWEVQPKRDQDSVWQISRFADTISAIQWTKDYEHVLYLNGSRVFITELDNRDQRNINELIRFDQPPSQILSRVSANQIFFVANTGLSSELLSIDFPEFNNFFTQ